MQAVALGKFKDYISSLFQIKVLVNSSENVKGFLRQFNLTPAEFLRPFALINENKKIKVKSINSKDKMIPDFALSFYDLEEFQTPDKLKIDDTIKEVILTNPPDITFSKFNSFQTTEEADRHLNENRTHWFDRAFDILNDFTRFSHDLHFLDQPLAVINMVSCQKVDEILNLMTQTNKFLNQYNLLDCPKLILILFDSAKDIPDDAMILTNSIRAEYPNIYIKMVSVNSPQANYQDLWSTCIHRKYFLPNPKATDQPSKYGCPLLERDKDNLSDTCIELILKIIVPCIENKISSLDAHITLNKKGLKNTVKNFFKKTEKNENPNAYQMGIAESAARNLADLLFLIQDYEQALQIYKLSFNDFKNKSNKHYANCIEMSIYAQILSEAPTSKKEVDALFESFEMTFNLYASSQENLKFAARCLCFQIFAFFLYGKFNKDSIKFIIDSCHLLKDFCPLVYPLFLEQYSTLNLKLKPVRPRKYCLNLLFSGNKFSQFQLKKNALRCFLITNNYYSTSKWHILNEYSYLQLARFFFDIKDYFQSVNFQKLALNEARSQDSVDKHNNIVNEFARILKAIDNDRKNNQLSEETYIKVFTETNTINLPRIIPHTIDIYLDSESVYRVNNPEKHALRPFLEVHQRNEAESGEEVVKWLELLERVNSKNKSSGLQMNMMAAIREKNNFRMFDCRFLEEKNQLFNKKERFCYVGETIFVEVEFENPLKIVLDLKNIKTLYEFEPLSGPTERNLSSDKPSEYLDISFEKLQIPQLSNCNPCVLRVVPKIPGKLKLVGLQWHFLKMNSRFFFDFKGKKLKDGVSYEKNLKNVFEVLPKASQLQVSFENFEEDIYFGEVRPLQVKVRNLGPQRVKKVLVSTSHPHFFGFPSKNIEGLELEAGETKGLSLMLRGSFLQKTEIKLLFKYILEENIHKTVRIVLPLKVLPSFNFTAYGYQLAKDYLVNLQIENYLANDTFKPEKPFDLLESAPSDGLDFSISSLFLLSRNWEFSSLQASSPPAQTPDHNNLLFYVKKNSSDSEKMKLILLQEDKEAEEEHKNESQKSRNGSPHHQKRVGKLEKFNMETNTDKCLNLGGLGAEELEKIASEMGCFANQDNYLLYSKYWFYDFDFFHPELMSMAVYWRFRKPNGEKAQGMISVSKVLMNKPLLNNLVSKASPFDVNPLKIEISVVNRIQHDFSQIPICKVPVKFLIRNHCFPEKVSFKLELLNSDEPLQYMLFLLLYNFLSSKTDFSFPYFIWEGITERDFIELEPNKHESFNVNVCFFEPGCFDLTRVRLTFFRNRMNKQMTAPISLKTLMGVDHIETKHYYLQNQECFVTVF